MLTSVSFVWNFLLLWFRLYYTRIPRGQDYPVYCRRRQLTGTNTIHPRWKKMAASVLGWDDQDEEEVLLDQNALAEQFGTELSTVIILLVLIMYVVVMASSTC